jgi:CheY-like chemotaxis protein
MTKILLAGRRAPIESGRRHGKDSVHFTAQAMVQDKKTALAGACADFDTKPVELPRLLEKINSLLQNGG